MIDHNFLYFLKTIFNSNLIHPRPLKKIQTSLLYYLTISAPFHISVPPSQILAFTRASILSSILQITVSPTPFIKCFSFSLLHSYYYFQIFIKINYYFNSFIIYNLDFKRVVHLNIH